MVCHSGCMLKCDYRKVQMVKPELKDKSRGGKPKC